MDKASRIAVGSIGLGAVVLGLKTAAWRVTGSAALYSDALETVVNVAASALAYAALRVAAMPADSNHPYGHTKAEFLAAVAEGVLIVLAAVSILQHAWAVWWHPQPIGHPGLGLGLNAAATVLNLAWARVLLRVGSSERSEALRADARHLMSDVVTSGGVLAGVVLVVLTGRLRLDPLIAAATAAYVLWSGMRVIGDSIGGLMDHAPSEEEIERIRQVVSEYGTGAIEAHDLRTRRAGRTTFVQFHLVVPGTMTVAESHAICDRIEAALTSRMKHLVVDIHVEPEGKAKHHGVLVL